MLFSTVPSLVCLDSHQQCTRIPFYPQIHQHLLFFDLLISAITTSVKWYFIVLLICISLMTNDVEHFFHVSMGPLYILLGEMSLQVLYPFFNWIVCLPGAEPCELSLYLEIKPLSELSLANMLQPYSWFPFHFADVLFSHAGAF